MPPKGYRHFNFILPVCVVSALAFAASAGAGADESAQQILKRCKAAELHAQSLRAVCYQTTKSDGTNSSTTARILLRKPNYARVELMSGQSAVATNLYCDGRNLYSFNAADRTFTKAPARSAADSLSMPLTASSMVGSIFVEPAMLDQLSSSGFHAYRVGHAHYAGIQCKAVFLRQAVTPYSAELTLYIGPDYILRGLVMNARMKDGSTRMESRLEHVRINVPAPKREFAWAPPKSMQPADEAVVAAPTGDDLLKPGTDAPEFTLTELHKAPVQFSSIYKANKVTILNFWDAG